MSKNEKISSARSRQKPPLGVQPLNFMGLFLLVSGGWKLKTIFETTLTRWWFQPTWKILVKNGSFPQFSGWKKKTMLKPPPRKTTAFLAVSTKLFLRVAIYLASNNCISCLERLTVWETRFFLDFRLDWEVKHHAKIMWRLHSLKLTVRTCQGLQRQRVNEWRSSSKHPFSGGDFFVSL